MTSSDGNGKHGNEAFTNGCFFQIGGSPIEQAIAKKAGNIRTMRVLNGDTGRTEGLHETIVHHNQTSTSGTTKNPMEINIMITPEMSWGIIRVE